MSIRLPAVPLRTRGSERGGKRKGGARDIRDATAAWATWQKRTSLGEQHQQQQQVWLCPADSPSVRYRQWCELSCKRSQEGGIRERRGNG